MSKEQSYKRSIERMLSDSRMSKANLETLKKYDTQGILQQVTTGTRVARLSTLRQLAIFVNKDFKAMEKQDIENYFSSLRNLNSKTWTVKGAFIKSFFKWLYNTDDYPSNVKWIKTSTKNNKRKLPSDLLTQDEIKAMAKAGDPMERTFIMVLYESACRIGEILNLKIKDVSVDQYGSVLMVDGKTGMRRIRLIDSSPDLVTWINDHPKKHDRESYLFIQLYDKNHSETLCKGLTDSYVSTMLIKLVKKARIEKHVHPHLFRHSRLTELARDFSESELKIIAGWSGNSNMAGVYVHLSGGDIEKKMLERRGLLNQGVNVGFGRYPLQEREDRKQATVCDRVQEYKNKRNIYDPGLNPVSSEQTLPHTSDCFIQKSKNKKNLYDKIISPKVKFSPGKKLTLIPDKKLTEIHNKRGRPKLIIQGFTYLLYKFIKKHKGVSLSDICDISLKKRESVKPLLSRLKNYGLIINSNGNWYPTSKEPIP